MRKRRVVLFSAVIAIGLGFIRGAWAQSATPAASPEASPQGMVSGTVVTVHGKITSVNKAKKLVTLEGPEGRKVTLRVENPYNLNAAKVGAPFVARYYEVVTIRKRKPGENVPGASLS